MSGFAASYDAISPRHNRLDAITPRHAHACNCIGCCPKCGCCRTYPGHNAETCKALQANSRERALILTERTHV